MPSQNLCVCCTARKLVYFDFQRYRFICYFIKICLSINIIFEFWLICASIRNLKIIGFSFGVNGLDNNAIHLAKSKNKMKRSKIDGKCLDRRWYGIKCQRKLSHLCREKWPPQVSSSSWHKNGYHLSVDIICSINI